MAVEKIGIGVSACLLGEKVRYDGRHKLDRHVTETLGQYFEYVPVCPEVEYGLPVPREPMRLVRDPASPRLVTIRTGTDHTAGVEGWARQKLDDLEHEGICGFIFKSRSPSCGLKDAKVYKETGGVGGSRPGIFAAAFTKRYPLVPVIDDERLHDPDSRETFIDAVSVFRRWKELQKKGDGAKDLVALHTELKLLILAHSPRHYTELGRMVARAGALDATDLHARYGALLMEGLHRQATRSKNVNVLLHGMGYFKKLLTRDEKEELLDAIEEYCKGLTPLIAPMTLINHYVRKYDEPYLKRQLYFNPRPAELMLKYHA